MPPTSAPCAGLARGAITVVLNGGKPQRIRFAALCPRTGARVRLPCSQLRSLAGGKPREGHPLGRSDCSNLQPASQPKALMAREQFTSPPVSATL